MFLAISGCGYPRIEFEAYELAKALNTICNLKKPEQLSLFRDVVEQKQAAGELSADEAEILLGILQIAEAGEWERARDEVRRLLLDQNSQA